MQKVDAKDYANQDKNGEIYPDISFRFRTRGYHLIGINFHNFQSKYKIENKKIQTKSTKCQ